MNVFAVRALIRSIITGNTPRKVRQTLFEIDPQDQPLLAVGGPTVREVRKALFQVEDQDTVLDAAGADAVLDALFA